MRKILLALSLVFLNYFVEAKAQFYIKVLNGISGGHSAGIDYYSISSGDSLQLTAVFQSFSPMTNITGLTVDWYLNDIYQFTAGGTVKFGQLGLIYFRFSSPSYSSVISENKVQLTIVAGINDPVSSTLPYPLSQLSPNIDLHHLRYAIVNASGKIVENGIFFGEIILRNSEQQRQLPAGIYLVIYYDALDNRQVLIDKVFVGSQP